MKKKPEEPNFDNLMKEISAFEKKAGFEKTSKKQLVTWIKEEVKNYENAKTDLIKRNKLLDIIALVMQIAIREDYSLDSAWKRWWKKNQKYLKRKS